MLKREGDKTKRLTPCGFDEVSFLFITKKINQTPCDVDNKKQNKITSIYFTKYNCDFGKKSKTTRLTSCDIDGRKSKTSRLTSCDIDGIKSKTTRLTPCSFI